MTLTRAVIAGTLVGAAAALAIYAAAGPEDLSRRRTRRADVRAVPTPTSPSSPTASRRPCSRSVCVTTSRRRGAAEPVTPRRPRRPRTPPITTAVPDEKVEADDHEDEPDDGAEDDDDARHGGDDEPDDD